ncbi:MAG: hypothetical protein HOP19_05115 [Acidobacteria bacterium]|nr:hypothetical protein [Acidobacteriota bacterium]
MLETYYGTLHNNNTLEWSTETSPDLAGNESVQVMVTLLQKDTQEPSGEAMADAMRAIAAMPNRTIIEDPSAWQREIRQDRPLPGRE